jgi:hypothetical protein
VKPGGTLIVIETLGTGFTEPAAPAPELADYYAWLESQRGFGRHALRTDYGFDSVSEAARVLGFFFGEQMAALVAEGGSPRVPECTGIWSKRLAL